MFLKINQIIQDVAAAFPSLNKLGFNPLAAQDVWPSPGDLETYKGADSWFCFGLRALLSAGFEHTKQRVISTYIHPNVYIII